MLDLDSSSILDSLLALIVAFTLALPIAWHRERDSRRVGFRTLPLRTWRTPPAAVQARQL